MSDELAPGAYLATVRGHTGVLIIVTPHGTVVSAREVYGTSMHLLADVQDARRVTVAWAVVGHDDDWVT